MIKRKTRRPAERDELRRLRQRAVAAIVEAEKTRADFETSVQKFRATAQRRKQS